MYVPATPVQPAPALAPVGVVSAAPATFGAPLESTLKVRREQLNVLENHATTVTGTLLENHHPGLAGRVVALQALIGRGWRTIATAHTATHGRFHIGLRPRRLGSRLLRLRFR